MVNNMLNVLFLKIIGSHVHDTISLLNAGNLINVQSLHRFHLVAALNTIPRSFTLVV